MVRATIQLVGCHHENYGKDAALSFKKICWLFGVPLVLFAGIVFYLYAHNLGDISHTDAAWNSFGSLLSGVFTLVGAGATIGTLLFLSKQNQDMQKVTQAQLSALNFEQYINHRRLFMDRLVELQATFENKFVFVNGERLYNKIFPNNGPTNLEFNVVPFSNDTGENLLGRIGAHLAQLEQMLDKSEWKGRDPLDLASLMLDVYGDLQIRWIDQACDGDIKFFEKNTGVNIYSVDEFTYRAKTIYNSLLLYTGNPQFKGFDKGNSRYVREALMNYFIDNHKLRGSVEVVKITPDLEMIENLFFITDSLRGADHDWILKDTFRTLESVFISRESVMNLRDDSFIRNLGKVGCNECITALSIVDANNKDYLFLTRCHNDLSTLRTRNSISVSGHY